MLLINRSMKALSFVEELKKDYQFWVKPFLQTKMHPPVTVDNLSKEQILLMLSKLECVKFSGVKLSKLEFKNFLAKFQNWVIHLESNEVKLTLSKSFLSDYTFQLISHLTFESCNYVPCRVATASLICKSPKSPANTSFWYSIILVSFFSLSWPPLLL